MKFSPYTVAAIILGCSLVAVAFIARTPHSAVGDQVISPVRIVDQNLYGSPRADITIVEFSDVECPFCARIHPTIKRLVDESAGAVNWEYRHLPLPFHENAEYGALVSECVGRALGNDAFWLYLDEVFANQSQITVPFLQTVAFELGLSEAALRSCETDEGIANVLANDAAAAAALGGSGTPYSVIVFPDGTLRPVSGALPYEQWVSLLSYETI